MRHASSIAVSYIRHAHPRNFHRNYPPRLDETTSPTSQGDHVIASLRHGYQETFVKRIGTDPLTVNTEQVPVTHFPTKVSPTLSKAIPVAMKLCYCRFQSTFSIKWNIAKMMFGYCYTLNNRLTSGYFPMSFVEPSFKIIASIEMMESTTRGSVIVRRLFNKSPG